MKMISVATSPLTTHMVCNRVHISQEYGHHREFGLSEPKGPPRPSRISRSAAHMHSDSTVIERSVAMTQCCSQINHNTLFACGDTTNIAHRPLHRRRDKQRVSPRHWQKYGQRVPLAHHHGQWLAETRREGESGPLRLHCALADQWA